MESFVIILKCGKLGMNSGSNDLDNNIYKIY